MFFNEDHLVVKKPITTDGVNLLIRDGRVKEKIIRLPKSAKPFLEKRNKVLPDNLKMKIQEVKGYVPAPAAPTVDVAALQAELATLRAEKAQAAETAKPVKETK